MAMKLTKRIPQEKRTARKVGLDSLLSYLLYIEVVEIQLRQIGSALSFPQY